MSSSADAQAARLTIDYPDRDLDRVATALRLVYAIPVMIVLGVVAVASPATRRVRPEGASAPSAAGCWCCRSC